MASVKEFPKNPPKPVEEDRRDVSEEVPQGEFSKAFFELCEHRGFGGLIAIQLWPQRPLPTGEMLSGTPVSMSPESTSREIIETVLHEPLKEEFPRSPILYVQLQDPENGDSIIQLVVRNWEIDDRMLHVLQSSCKHIERLRTIRLWNVGMKPGKMPTLIEYLASISNLSHLHLDNNPLEGEDYSCLFKEPLRLRYLSVRFSNVTDKGAKIIGSMLSNTYQANEHLLSLNLNGNVITDIGASYLAQGLRLNKTLLTLSLVGNRISDAGAEEFASVMQPSFLTADEIGQRRSLLLKMIFDEKRGEKISSLKSGNNNTPTKKLSITKTEMPNLINSFHYYRYDYKEWFKIPDHKLYCMNFYKEIKSNYEISSVDSMLLFSATMDQNSRRLRLPGNFTLTSLNLAKNRIGANGVEKLLQVILYQQESNRSKVDATKIANRLIKGGGRGIIRLVLKENKIQEDDKVYVKLKETLKILDPLKQWCSTYTELQKRAESSPL